jgi:hypothetical protein
MHVRYKDKVVARFPNAQPVVTERWPDGYPRRVDIFAGARKLTLDAEEDSPQMYNGAWRQAWRWCCARDREARKTG